MSEFDVEPEWDKKKGPKPAPEEPPVPEDAPDLPPLLRGSDLEGEEPEPPELGFEQGNLYKGQQIVDVSPVDPAHEYLFDEATAPLGRVRSFYVKSKEGTYGLVPWPGSHIVWPHEQAWKQDLYHAQMTPEKIKFRQEFAKAQAEKKGKK